MGAEGEWDDDEDVELVPTSDGAGLDGVPDYAPAVSGSSDDDGGWLASDHAGIADEPGAHGDVSFTISNPSGTLSATAALGGRMQRIDLMGGFKLDEAQLGEEIVELATLAREKALAAQHEVTAELMRSLGQDRAGVSSLLTHTIGLPTYESASARSAEVFTARYHANDD